MVDLGKVFSIMFTGLVVVFIALVLLIAVIWIVGKINGSMSGKLKQNKENNTDLNNLNVSDSKENNAEPYEDKYIIAAITAAIISYRGSDSFFKIKNIRCDYNEDNIWRTAGLIENTRPF